MITKLNFRSVVFKRAYCILKQTCIPFSEALKQAWQRYREYRAKVVADLTTRINGFDFYYNYSDDGRVYRYWSNCKQEIRESLNIHACFISAISNRLNNSKYIKKFI